MNADEKKRRFLTVKQLTERWNCSRQTIERLARTDPDFPDFYKIGTNKRTVREDEAETYERRSVVSRREV